MNGFRAVGCENDPLKGRRGKEGTAPPTGMVGFPKLRRKGDLRSEVREP